MPNNGSQQSADDVADVISQLSTLQIVAQLGHKGLTMALSYTFPASLIATAVMITHLHGKESDNYLAVATLVTTTLHFAACISFSPFLAIVPINSQQYGQLKLHMGQGNDALVRQDQANIANLFGASMLSSTIIMPFPTLFLYFSGYILSNWFAQNYHISILAQEYLRIYAYAIPGLMYRIDIEQILFSFERSQHTMYMGLITFGIGTFVAYYLAFTCQMGLRGIAYGYLTESYLTFSLFGIYMLLSPLLRDIPFITALSRWRTKEVSDKNVEILKMGLPITASLGSELVAALLMGLFAGWLSEDALAAQNFSVQLFIFAVIPADSFAQNLVQVVGALIGGRHFADAARFANIGLFTNLGLMSLICLPIAIEPSILTQAFSSDVSRPVMNIARSLIVMAAAQTLSDTAGLSMTQVLRHAHDPYTPTMLRLSCLWLGVLVAYLLGFKSPMGIYGVNTGFLLGSIMGTACLIPRWIEKMKPEYLKMGKVSTKIMGVFANPLQHKLIEGQKWSEEDVDVGIGEETPKNNMMEQV